MVVSAADAPAATTRDLPSAVPAHPRMVAACATLASDASSTRTATGARRARRYASHRRGRQPAPDLLRSCCITAWDYSDAYPTPPTPGTGPAPALARDQGAAQDQVVATAGGSCVGSRASAC
jgi:hypothetical protein